MDARQLAEEWGRSWNADAPRDLVEKIFSTGIVDHNPQPGQEEGRDGIRKVPDRFHAALPDLRVTNDDVFASGDRAVLRRTAVGTHEGDGLGIQATHREVRITGIDILRVEDGQIAERWAEWNGLETMQQMGAI
jgi:predicted ester cyclase